MTSIYVALAFEEIGSHFLMIKTKNGNVFELKKVWPNPRFDPHLIGNIFYLF